MTKPKKYLVFKAGMKEKQHIVGIQPEWAREPAPTGVREKKATIKKKQN